MRPTKKVIPSICKEGGDYEGYVSMYVPTYDERMEFFEMQEFEDVIMSAAKKKLENKEEEETEKEYEMFSAKKSMAIMKRLRSKLPEWVAEVKITRKDDGFVFDTYQSCQYDSEVGAIAQELVNELIGKYRYGNPNMPQS